MPSISGEGTGRNQDDPIYAEPVQPVEAKKKTSGGIVAPSPLAAGELPSSGSPVEQVASAPERPDIIAPILLPQTPVVEEPVATEAQAIEAGQKDEPPRVLLEDARADVQPNGEAFQPATPDDASARTPAAPPMARGSSSTPAPPSSAKPSLSASILDRMDASLRSPRGISTGGKRAIADKIIDRVAEDRLEVRLTIRDGMPVLRVPALPPSEQSFLNSPLAQARPKGVMVNQVNEKRELAKHIARLSTNPMDPQSVKRAIDASPQRIQTRYRHWGQSVELLNMIDAEIRSSGFGGQPHAPVQPPSPTMRTPRIPGRSALRKVTPPSEAPRMEVSPTIAQEPDPQPTNEDDDYLDLLVRAAAAGKGRGWNGPPVGGF